MAEDTPEQIIEEITQSKEIVSTSHELHSSRRKVVNKYITAIAVILLAALFTYYFLSQEQLLALQDVLNKEHHKFYWMLLVGFGAELVAGSMGMGYGVICTSLLLIFNVPPNIVSASIHSAEAFTSAAGTVSHWQLGNINKKLVWALAIPAIIGAVLGAISLTHATALYAKILKPVIAAYTIYLGLRIMQNAFKKKKPKKQKQQINITVLGFIGGFIDSFGGGGWGPLVTGTFIKNGRTPRYVIGSSTFAKCLLTIASAATFFVHIKEQQWNVIAGLLIGGIITAPFSAMLTSKLPTKKMFVAVGVVVIICGLVTIVRAFL
ncbi:MAG: sulfite exporter TauE/SafE family protein [Bacteroidetes bacterium]|nr:sulfite exporter TauE/SafE family protein [Bacteroidota bacterium]